MTYSILKQTLASAAVVLPLLVVPAACADAQDDAAPPVAVDQSAAAIQPFEIMAGDNVVAGEVHSVAGADAETVIIVVGGSGVGLRADTAQAVPLFLNESTAVAIYDRRSFGRSTGNYERPGTQNSAWLVPALAGDVAAMARHLRATGFERVGVMGSSMGGWVAVSSASASDDIDFIVNFVGGAVPVAVSDAFDGLTDQGLSIEAALAEAQAAAADIGYDPGDDLDQMTQRALWVLAARDDSNPTALDARALDARIAAGKPFAYVVVENADHNLVDLDSGEVNLSWLPELQAFVAGGEAP